MARVHCLDCATDVVVDPAGLCPSGHHLGVNGERVDEAIGSHTPHPDEPEPWVGRIDPAEVVEAPPAPAVSAPMPQTAPGLAPAAPPPVDTQDLFAELGALGDDEPGTNGHGPAHEPAAAPPLAAAEPWQAPQTPDAAAPSSASPTDPEPWQTSPASTSTQQSFTQQLPETADESAPTDTAPVRSVPAGGPEAREALSEISALEAAVRSLTDDTEGPAAPQPQPEERMFAAAPPPPPAPPAAATPAPAAPTPPAPTPANEQQDLRRAAFADVAALGFESAAPSDQAPTPDAGGDAGYAPEPVAYEQPQAAGAEGQPPVGFDTMNFTAKGGRMRRSDQPKRRLFGR